ncbi:MAG: imidazole glycerol phosphate synthase subunit HisH [Phycisphaerales bacterium]|nr:imidazole glycerol phosphate synthase subunit HisH [Phycisphaerales bacterium]
MIGIIDYGAGNLRSVSNALDALGVTWQHVREPAALSDCTRIILPGVGHFASAVEKLAEINMMDALRAVDKPLLGVCLGAQLLFDTSDEAPGVSGLGLIPGNVALLTTRTVPHMGWNQVTPRGNNRLFDSATPRHFYFAHSYVCEPADNADIAADVTHEGATFCVAVQCGNVCGVQFHPEKSASAGMDLLRRFATC